MRLDLGGFAYTQRASEGKVYAMYHMDEGEKLGRTLVIPFNQEAKRVTLLDCGEVAFKYVELTGDEYAAAGITRGIEVTLPYQLNGTCPIMAPSALKCDGCMFTCFLCAGVLNDWRVCAIIST